jgi:hypothetical protein
VAVQAASTLVRQASTQASSAISSLNSRTASTLTAQSTLVTSTINAARTQLQSDASVRLASLQSTIQSELEPMTAMQQALARTHYMNPAVPFFRWTMFHVYSNNGIGWFDGNNPRCVPSFAVSFFCVWIGDCNHSGDLCR